MAGESLWKAAGRALVGTVVLLVFMLLDPMGIDNASDRHSADVVSRITAPFYGGPDYEGRSRIAVVQISDQTLNNHGGWPPDRLFYARLLKRLAGGEEKPAVVFFDYAFVGNAEPEDRAFLLQAIEDVTRYKDWTKDPKINCQASALEKIKCIVDAGGVPVVVGKVYPPNACLSGVSRLDADEGDDVRLFHTAVVTPLGWPDLPTQFHFVLTRESYTRTLTGALDGEKGLKDRKPGERAAERIAACDDLNPASAALAAPPVGEDEPTTGRELGPAPAWAPLGLGKPLTADPYSPGPPVFGYDLTPAPALLYALCRHDADREEGWPKAAGRTALCATLEAARKARQPPDLEKVQYAGPEWGSVGDPENRRVRAALYPGEEPISEEACKAEQRSVFRALHVGWSQFHSGLGKGAAAVAVPCPYHLTLDADLLLDNQSGQLEGLRLLLKDRAVLIGAAQALSNDWIPTTLNAQQAGVHYHAMTLDNLLEKGQNLRRQPPALFEDEGPLGWLGFDAGELLELVCAFLILLLIERVRGKLLFQADEATEPLPSFFNPRRYLKDPPATLSWFRALRRAYILYWDRTRPERYGIVQVTGVLIASALVMIVAVGLTVLWLWEPLNVVGLVGFTVLAVAWELWSHKGWTSILGFLIAVLLLAPAPTRARWRQWFLHRQPRPAPEPAPEPDCDPEPAAEPPAAAKPAAAKRRPRRKDS